MTTSFSKKLTALGVAALFLAASVAQAATAYTGQGLVADGFGGYDLNRELCGLQNGADAEGPYLLWVYTASGATSATITGPWGTAAMTKMSKGTFKYVSAWYAPATLPGAVSATATGTVKKPQLVVSHGCRPYTSQSAWCSPGYWGHALDGAWTRIGRSPAELFNATVYSGMYGNTFGADPTLATVLGTTGGTYKGAGVAGSDPRTQSPNAPMNAFNATGAWLTDQIPGFTFDPAVVGGNESDTCPIDHFGNLKTE
jgi:hypothetical protein